MAVRSRRKERCQRDAVENLIDDVVNVAFLASIAQHPEYNDFNRRQDVVRHAKLRMSSPLYMRELRRILK